MRNRRGQYQSIDANAEMLPPPVPQRGQSHTAGTSQRVQVKKANNRLKVIEQISQYRQHKIEREFKQLEQDLRVE
jgi:hypothetical protein